MFKFLIIVTTAVLLFWNTYFFGWHSGYQTGYDAGIADVYLDLVNPEQYIFKRENLKPIPKRTIIKYGK